MGIDGPLSTDKPDYIVYISSAYGAVNDVLLLLAYVFIKSLETLFSQMFGHKS